MTNAELIDELRGHILSVPLTLLHDAADALEAAEKRIAELEAQLPKEGEWIWEDSVCSPRICSVCKQKFYIGRGWNYCPNCGAKMRGEQDFCERCHIDSDMENVDDWFCADGERRSDEQQSKG